MPDKALHLHGVDDDPREKVDPNGDAEKNYYAWFAGKLSDRGFLSHIPKLPTGENQTRDLWLAKTKKFITRLGPNDILSGRSMGATMGLIAPSAFDFKAKIFCCVAGWINEEPIQCDISESKADCDSFVSEKPDWEKVGATYSHVIVAYAEDDPVVHRADGERIAFELKNHTDVTVLKFTEEQGFEHFKRTEFQELLEAVDQKL